MNKNQNMPKTPAKTKKLVIVGAGEFGLIAYEYFTHDSAYEVVSFAVEKQFMEETTVCNLPVIPFEELQNSYSASDVEIYVAVTNVQLNRARKRLYNQVKNWGYTCASYISSKAFMWHNVEVGDNTFIFENNTLQPFTKIGNNVVLWSGNHIGHRSSIADHCFITSHVVISGYVEVGEHCFIGVNASFANNINIAEDNFIAMGAVITKSTEADKIYKGHPAEAGRLSAKKYCKVRAV